MFPDYTSKDIERFWTKINRTVDPSACWEWQAYRMKNGGYGQLTFFGKSMLAHRMAWILANGDIPSGMFICHRCDNPPCCNPSHLFLGTRQDNMLDMISKGRHCHHESRPDAKINMETANRIRELYAGGSVTQQDLADMFGLCHTSINYIINNRKWKA